MNRMEWKFERHAHGTFRRVSGQSAFTLIEILVVVTIVGILMSLLGAVITNSVRKAREAATTALIQKIEGLLDERIKGFERATKSRDFQNTVLARKAALEANGLFGVSPKVIEAVARKDFFRQYFPQRFEDLADGEDRNFNGLLDIGEDSPPFNGTLDGANGVPDRLEQVPGLSVAILQSQEPAIPTNPASSPQRHITESSELLYFALTQMEVFGVPPVGESEFSTSEVRDTDGDGLSEFIDGWGRPLRFYRWPTRLFKPSGPYGPDYQPGSSGGANFLLFGTLGSDDVSLGRVVPPSPPPGLPLDIRPIAGLLIDGLSAKPALPLQQWDPLSEDPDDPYGLITTELKRLFVQYGNLIISSYQEPFYPTLDTYHTPLIVSVGADGELGLYEPFEGGSDTNSDGILEDVGALAQPKHGPGDPYDIPSDVISALTDNLTNRNRRAGRGK